MSTFNGFINEIDGISVDRFTKENFQSKLFFLSHCHADHMIGLSSINSENELPGPLYLSEVSLIIVKRKFPLIKNVIPLKIGGRLTIVKINENGWIIFILFFFLSECIPIAISTNDSSNISVTALPAGHCPGSIMLLFEQNDEKILYTGDFR